MYLARSPFAMPRVLTYPLAPAKKHIAVNNQMNQSIILPKADIFEDSQNIYFDFEIPGVNKEDVSIKINDDKVLALVAKKFISNPNMGNNAERKFHEYKRSFQLEGEFQEEQINASLKDGILSVKIPKRLPIEKHIEIN